MTPLKMLSSLSAESLEGGYMYLSFVMSQGGGIHVEEEFDPCIRVLFIITCQMISNFVLDLF